MAMATCKEGAKRILKCFCGCSDLTEDEVKRIYRLNSGAILIDRPASQLLRKFMEQKRSGDKSESEQYLEVYEQCRNYLLDDNRLLTLDDLDELSDLGLPYHLERDLKTQMLTGDRSNIRRCLTRIQGECRNEIESSAEYKEFKQALLDKLKQ